MKCILIIFAFFYALPLPQTAFAGTELDAFLYQIKQRAITEKLQNEEREREFRADLDDARRRAKEVQKLLDMESDRQKELLHEFNTNEEELIALEQSLKEYQGGLGEMFGVVRQSAGDFHARFVTSLPMADQPEAMAFLNELGNSRNLPGMDELERFWLMVLKEMVGSGRGEFFNGEVVLPNGLKHERDILRVGTFNAVSEGLYLSHVQGRNQFLELPRQPQGQYIRQARDLENAAAGKMRFFALDPSQGPILSQLVQSPSLGERIMQGREIGMVILALGFLGVILFAVRFSVLSIVARRVNLQLNSHKDMQNNPIGRIRQLYNQNPDTDPHTMEIKQDEAILKEVPRLERGLTTIKILAAVAPLMGLLGTVVGMIETFQSITLFGTGDPKLMAGGISQALVTTALGLTVAIPLLFLHSIAAAKSRYLVTLMEEQGAGMLANHIQKMHSRKESQ